MSTVPQVLTKRLKLRAHCATDHPAAIAIWRHREVYQYITGAPLSEQDVWLRLLRYSGLWELLGYGCWAIEERSSGHYVGHLGFADFKRGLLGFDGSYPEAGWVLDPNYAGRGYAAEAMLAACAWLDQHVDCSRSFCIIAPENQRSVRLADKLGYRYVMDTLMGDEKTAVYFRDTPSQPESDPA